MAHDIDHSQTAITLFEENEQAAPEQEHNSAQEPDENTSVAIDVDNVADSDQDNHASSEDILPELARKHTKSGQQIRPTIRPTKKNSNQENLELLSELLYEAFKGKEKQNKDTDSQPLTPEQIEQILNQCQIWHEENNFVKIFETLNDIPPDEHTPEIDMELARACNNLGSAEMPEFYWKAIELLMPHSAQFQNTYYWNFRMGYAYFYLEWEWLARNFFEDALKARPGDEDTLAFIRACDEALCLQRFSRNFATRVKEVWDEFLENEGLWRLQLGVEATMVQAVTEINRLFSLALENALIEIAVNPVSPKGRSRTSKKSDLFAEKHFTLSFNMHNFYGNMFEIRYIIAMAPKKLSRYWTFRCGVAQTTKKNLEFEGSKFKLNTQDLRIKLVPKPLPDEQFLTKNKKNSANSTADNEAHDGINLDQDQSTDLITPMKLKRKDFFAPKSRLPRFAIYIYHKELLAHMMELEAQNHEDSQAQFNHIVQTVIGSVISAVGEIVANAAFGTVHICMDESGLTEQNGTEIKIDELLPFLEQHGYNPNLSIDEYFDSFVRVEYNPQPHPETDGRWRTDTFSGYSLCPNLINEFLQYKSNMVNHWHMDGVASCYIGYQINSLPETKDLSIDQQGLTADATKVTEERLKLRQDIIAAIKKVNNKAEIIGAAHGVFFDYIDLLCFTDLLKVLKNLRKFFLDIRFPGQVFISPFRHIGVSYLYYGLSDKGYNKQNLNSHPVIPNTMLDPDQAQDTPTIPPSTDQTGLSAGTTVLTEDDAPDDFILAVAEPDEPKSTAPAAATTAAAAEAAAAAAPATGKARTTARSTRSRAPAKTRSAAKDVAPAKTTAKASDKARTSTRTRARVKSASEENTATRTEKKEPSQSRTRSITKTGSPRTSARRRKTKTEEQA